MIWDSSYWRRDLLETVQALKRVASRRRPSGKLCAEVEKRIFYGAFAVRKLMEAQVLSTKTRNAPIPVRVYRTSGMAPMFFNWHHIDRFYSLGDPQESCLALLDVCNQLVHSYVFLPVTSSLTGPIKEIMFSSDRTRGKCLFQASLADLAQAFQAAAMDYPSQMRCVLDKNRGDYVITSG